MTRIFTHLPVVSFLLALVLLAPVVLASDLYTGEAVLPDDGGMDDRAVRRALDEVLLRLTGQVEHSPVESLALGSAEINNLVQARHTVRRDRLQESGETVTELRARVEFDQRAVDRLLREHGMPRWGRERPAILLWMAVEDEEGATFAEDPWLEAVVAEQARRLGLDIVWPLGDALDMAEVALADIRGGFLDSAMPAARRYGSQVVAMLDLRKEPALDSPIWSARWYWRVGGADAGLQHTGLYRDMLIQRGMERLASAMASRYAVRESEGDSGVRRIRVEGIVDDVHFAEVQSYLADLSVVEDLRVVRAGGRSLEFELELGGEGLEQFLEMGGLVDRAGPPDGDVLLYRLRR
ncbi:DUF2066 domain-containing protein [Wenzhouxiangella sp. AB-CW3]|uniref:DUF2066 domain-containing protein n=1 Tax=Wenzhouxiangella sp. AB-CW3 TaxID=2771012 RepID=UPI00168C004A|nr:DUF2066 domain-containing protein [Wenzhouxiangella sp. AB-CW3]QOC21722.1 DUF2066 domain-containing protein [Wenzhouxiangella sp. AB-CW3]